MKVREAAVAGSFYPKEKAQLLEQLKGFFKGIESSGKSSCVVAPHAGYIYSGRIAAVAFNSLQDADSFVVLSPNHTGLGEAISVSDAGYWETPLGKAEIDVKLRQNILDKMGIGTDEVAHVQEHSVEVQLPFIQFLFPKAKILPITLMAYGLGRLEELGEVLYGACEGKNVGIVASSDFSHFIPEGEAKEKDMEAIKFIEKMDIEGFHSLVTGKRLSICGFAPIVAAMAFCRKMGLERAELLRYGTSASATNDGSSVVGYAAIKFA